MCAYVWVGECVLAWAWAVCVCVRAGGRVRAHPCACVVRVPFSGWCQAKPKSIIIAGVPQFDSSRVIIRKTCMCVIPSVVVRAGHQTLSRALPSCEELAHLIPLRRGLPPAKNWQN